MGSVLICGRSFCAFAGAELYRGVLLKDLQAIEYEGVYVSNETVHVTNGFCVEM